MKYIDPGNLKCQFCSFISPKGVAVLLGHIGATHKKVLQFLPVNQEKVGEHSPNTLPLSDFQCIHCEKKLTTEHQLDIHYCLEHYREKLQAMFNSVDPKLCPLCGILIRNQSGMIVHIGTVHKKMKELLNANLRISSPVNFSSIVDIPKKMPPSFKCQLCPKKKTFSRRGNLYEHYSLCHYREDIMTIVSENDLACPICFKNMPDMNGLVRHVGGAHDKVELFLPKEYHIKRGKPAVKLKSKISQKKQSCQKNKEIYSIQIHAL